MQEGADCRGPFGDTIVKGTFNGRTTFAVYSVSDALPCCVWYSYSEKSTPPEVKAARWLPHEKVPIILPEDGWYTIEDNPPYEPDKGPLGGGAFVAKVCRTEN